MNVSKSLVFSKSSQKRFCMSFPAILSNYLTLSLPLPLTWHVYIPQFLFSILFYFYLYASSYLILPVKIFPNIYLEDNKEETVRRLGKFWLCKYESLARIHSQGFFSSLASGYFGSLVSVCFQCWGFKSRLLHALSHSVPPCPFVFYTLFFHWKLEITIHVQSPTVCLVLHSFIFTKACED